MFMQQFPKALVIRNGNVHVRSKGRRTTPRPNASAESFTMWDCGTDGRKFPVRTSVCVDVKSFENAEHSSLPSSWTPRLDPRAAKPGSAPTAPPRPIPRRRLLNRCTAWTTEQKAIAAPHRSLPTKAVR